MRLDLNISSAPPATPRSRRRPVEGAAPSYGMGRSGVERFSTGLAAELYADNIAVNALSPSRVVPPRYRLPPPDHRRRPAGAEPPSVIAEAALLLCLATPRC